MSENTNTPCGCRCNNSDTRTVQVNNFPVEAAPNLHSSQIEGESGMRERKFTLNDCAAAGLVEPGRIRLNDLPEPNPPVPYLDLRENGHVEVAPSLPAEVSDRPNTIRIVVEALNDLAKGINFPSDISDKIRECRDLDTVDVDHVHELLQDLVRFAKDLPIGMSLQPFLKIRLLFAEKACDSCGVVSKVTH